MAGVGGHRRRDRKKQNRLTGEPRNLGEQLRRQRLLAGDENGSRRTEVGSGLPPVVAESRPERCGERGSRVISDRLFDPEAVPQLRRVVVDKEELSSLRYEIEYNACWSRHRPRPA